MTGLVVVRLAVLRNGLKVVMTEATDWIGGQLISQGVPPDEHRWIEKAGVNRSYRELRSRIHQQGVETVWA